MNTQTKQQIQLDQYMIQQILGDDQVLENEVEVPIQRNEVSRNEKKEYKNKNKKVEVFEDSDEEQEYDEPETNPIYIECALVGALFFIFTNQSTQKIILEFIKTTTKIDLIPTNMWLLVIIAWYIIRTYVIKLFL